MKVQTRFFGMVVISILIPFVIIVSVAAYYGKKSLTDFMTDRVVGVNTVKKDTIEAIMHDVRESVVRIAALPAVVDGAKKLVEGKSADAAAKLDPVLGVERRVEDLNDIKIASPSEKILYVSNSLYRASVGTVATDRLKESIHNGNSGIAQSFPFMNAEGDEPYELYLSLPIKDAEGFTIAVLVAEMDFEPIMKVAEDATGLSDTGETVLAYNEGHGATVISKLKYRNDAPFNFTIPFGDRTGTAIQNGVRGQRGHGTVIDYRGNRTYAAWDAMPDLGWGIVTKIDEREALSAFGKVQNILLVVIPVILLVMMSISVITVQKSFVKPLKHLTEVAAQIAGGQEPDRIDHDLLYRHDEVGKIATSIHNLARTAMNGKPASAEDNKEAKLVPHHPDQYHGGKI